VHSFPFSRYILGRFQLSSLVHSFPFSRYILGRFQLSSLVQSFPFSRYILGRFQLSSLVHSFPFSRYILGRFQLSSLVHSFPFSKVICKSSAQAGSAFHQPQQHCNPISYTHNSSPTHSIQQTRMCELLFVWQVWGPSKTCSHNTFIPVTLVLFYKGLGGGEGGGAEEKK